VAGVTGGAGGIGRAIALRLLQAGARVVVTDLDAERIDEAVLGLSDIAPGRVAGLAGDASQTASIRCVIELAEARFGPVDLYVANAGILRGFGLSADDADWGASIDVNLMGHVRAAQLLVPGWVERGRGYFLSTASAAGLVTEVASPTYAVTKHAAVAFSEWLSVTYGSRGVAVSCLCPMGVNTAMLTSGESDERGAIGQKAVVAAGDVLEPLEVADLVLEGIEAERFLILPHPEVLEYFRRKGADYDRWIAGMQRFHDSLR
jgi:NAD(P)-dependent dehydrogenase (short-subunit alcohol dehydrogenase family)